MRPTPSRLIRVTIREPRVKGGNWIVRTEYNDGAVTMAVSSKEEAERLQTKILENFQR